MASKESAGSSQPAKVKTVKEERQVQREVKQKLSRLDPLARAEVVNDVVSRQFTGFIDFLREQSVVGLAIGLVFGTQVKQLVDAVVNNFINPLVGLILPGNSDLAKKTFTLHLDGKTAVFGWGSFISTFISFLAVTAIVYAIFRTLKLDRLAKKK
ncbi:MAG TPA: MscL family protein [Ktedonobacteraceae bacterium]|nr:MscL family protein [Ktedonobacteraceae bacterium]